MGWVQRLAQSSIEVGLGVFYPNVCQFCDRGLACAAEGYVCSLCWQRLRFVRHPFCQRCGLPFEGQVQSTFRCGNCVGVKFAFHEARAALIANEFSLELIHRYKYGGATWLEGLLADLLWDQMGTLGCRAGWDLVMPVPLHPTKQREREFNQAERLARVIAFRLGVPLETSLVKRVAPTATQTMLSRSERQKNVRGAFSAVSKRSLSGERVLVVDDVFTTGATTNECARILRRLGSSEVGVGTVVRGL